MTSDEIFEENLRHFKIVSRSKIGKRFQGVCPAHNDKQASLTITQGDTGTLFRCHAGCSFESILQAAGLEKKDVFYHDSAENAPDWKAYVEKREGRKIEAVYNYVNFRNGSYAFTKLRMTGKKMIYGILENNRFTYGLGGKGRKDFQAIYSSVSLKTLKTDIKTNKQVFIVEGEKDCSSLKKQGYTALTYGGVNDWQPEFAELLRGADVVILEDNDEPGRAVGQRICNDLDGIAKSRKIIVPVPDVLHADISDYFESGHTKEEFETLINNTNTLPNNRPSGAPAQLLPGVSSAAEVKSLLAYNYDKDGNPKSIKQLVKNFETVIDNDSRFAGKIRYNEFSRQTFLYGAVPWETECNFRPWGNSDDSALFGLIQADYGLTNRQDYIDALQNVATRNKFNPVKEMLDSFKWDGQEHIRQLLPEYLGVEDTEYNYQVMKLFMLGAVARIYQPSHKVDFCMILVGSQGLGKSTLLRLLALDDTWFNDSLDSLDGDKAVQSLTGSWIIELAELKSLARTAGGVESVKRFISATQDKIRLPYQRRAEVFLRQCVFAGTTNRSDFLQDETGNRRFLIVQTGTNKPTKSLFKPEALEDIKKAWAQAVYIWKNEKPVLVLPESCREEAEALQQENMADDGMRGIIEEYVTDKERVCARMIWFDALGQTTQPPKWKISEINTILSQLPGWEKSNSIRFGNRYGTQRGFIKVSTINEDFVDVDKNLQDEIPF